MGRHCRVGGRLCGPHLGGDGAAASRRRRRSCSVSSCVKSELQLHACLPRSAAASRVGLR